MSSARKLTTKVFISYSRRDLAFVDRLDEALRARGIEPLIDRQEIFAFEDWWRRIETLIASADTVVFVLSPDAVSSDVCRREVDHAGSLNKRFAPVVARAVDPALAPEALNRLNFIHLEDPATFEEGVDRLVEALATDIDWVRRHTEFGTLAQRWDAAGRPGPHGLLLRPPMLEEAERWIASRPANAPLPTEETQAIIAQSRRAETRRRARVTAVLGFGLAMALVLSAVAFWQRQVARESERLAIAAREAETQAREGEAAQRRLAETREREAIEAGDRVLVGQSRFLADASARSLAEKDAGTAILLALEALPDGSGVRGRPLVPEARQALDRGLAALAERNVAVRHAGFSLAFSADGRRAASFGAEEIVVADGVTGALVARAGFGRGTNVGLELSVDGETVLRCSEDEARLLDLRSSRQEALELVGGQGAVDRLVACRLARDGRVLLADRRGRAAWWSGKSADRPVPVELPAGLTIHGLTPGAGELLASRPDGEAELRDPQSGALRAEIAGRGSAIEAMRASQDGRTVLLVDASGLRVWDVATSSAREIAVPKGLLFEVSRDGGLALLHRRWPMNSRGGGFEVWDLRKGERLAAVEDTAHLVALAFAVDGANVAGLGADGSVRLYEAATGRETMRLQGHQGRGLVLALNPNGRTVLSSGFDTRLALWDLAPGRASREVEAGSNDPVALIPLADGASVLTASGSRLSIRDTNGAGRDLLDLGGEVMSLALAANESRALALLRGGDAVLVDIAAGREVRRFSGAFAHDAFARDAAVVSPDGTRFAIVAGEGVVAIHDAANGQELRRHAVLVAHLAIASFVGNDRLLAWSKGGGAALLDLRSETVVSVIGNMPLAPDGTPIPIGRGRAWLSWDVVQASPDGRRLATSDGLQPRIWDLATGRLLRILPDHAITGSAGGLLFSPDGATLFTIERGRLVTAWDVESGSRLRSFTGHAGAIGSINLSRDGRFLLTGSQDRTARLWDVASGIEIAAFGPHPGPVREARFWPGRQIATTSSDGAVRFWPFSPDIQPEIERAKEALGRCLTQAQRRRFYLDQTPPAWCFTGPGLEREADAAKWRPRAPYHMPLWQNWYRQKQAGEAVPLPRTD